ncbi:alpha/beta fold hydrolase [Prescottella defluvii]|nr:alpha/beta fold hydrolase [Prescottella defluvii]
MRSGDGAEPLICVHPAIGLTWCYTGLIPHVTDGRPVYGIQSSGMTVGAMSASSMDELAARYVDLIRRVQAHGPYHLLGYSVGGAIAHAMAVRLRALGEDVGTLVMLDTQTTESIPGGARTRSLGMLFAEFAGIDSDERVDDDLTPERAERLLRDSGGAYARLTADDLRRIYDDYLHTINLGQEYRPETFDGDLVYFAADGEAGIWEPRGTATSPVRSTPIPWATRTTA